MGLRMLLRNYRKLLVILLLGLFFVIFLVQNNEQFDKQISIGEELFGQLRQLQNNIELTLTGDDGGDNSENHDDEKPVVEAGEEAAKKSDNKSVEEKNAPTINSLENLIFALGKEKEVSIWIDLPNAFPWRHCLQEYADKIATLSCDKRSKSQRFIIKPVINSNNSRQFHWRTHDNSKCIVPGGIVHEGKFIKSVKAVKMKECEEEAGHWIWTSQGQFQWSRGCGKCVTSFKFNTPVELELCRDHAEDQNLELGLWNMETDKLNPVDVDSWQQRQDTMRNKFLESERGAVLEAVREVDIDTMLHEYDTVDTDHRRRAAVFYVDKGSSAMSQVNWWVYTWRFIGLNTQRQGFDLVMMTHPAAVSKLPKDCVLVTDDFKISHNSSGQCLYKPYLGISYRDKAYDGYMNSQECLYGPGSEFLSQYDLLLRADLDTFPTPHMLDYWPQGVLVDTQYSTNHGLDNIKQALRELACSVGIQHREWFNMGSTWYGAGWRVRDLARVTVALNKFGRAQMFGPGTRCRCHNCTKLPRDCEWGGGPYAGTLLLYLQEIALNK